MIFYNSPMTFLGETRSRLKAGTTIGNFDASHTGFPDVADSGTNLLLSFRRKPEPRTNIMHMGRGSSQG